MGDGNVIWDRRICNNMTIVPHKAFTSGFQLRISD
jgi:hypothetical protein